MRAKGCNKLFFFSSTIYDRKKNKRLWRSQSTIPYANYLFFRNMLLLSANCRSLVILIDCMRAQNENRREISEFCAIKNVTVAASWRTLFGSPLFSTLTSRPESFENRFSSVSFILRERFNHAPRYDDSPKIFQMIRISRCQDSMSVWSCLYDVLAGAQTGKLLRGHNWMSRRGVRFRTTARGSENSNFNPGGQCGEWTCLRTLSMFPWGKIPSGYVSRRPTARPTLHSTRRDLWLQSQEISNIPDNYNVEQPGTVSQIIRKDLNPTRILCTIKSHARFYIKKRS